MKNFKDIDSLHALLAAVYTVGEGAVGRTAFAELLLEQFQFEPRQAELYGSTVLSKNSNGSADWASMNGYKVAGKWVRGDMTGSAGNLLVTKTETWQFNQDLTYRHTHESYEGYTSIVGSYSIPSSSSEQGIWAPSDRLDDETSIVAVAASGYCRTIKFGWLGSTQTIPPACLLDGERFSRR
jgi:hypothetical protein